MKIFRSFLILSFLLISTTYAEDLILNGQTVTMYGDHTYETVHLISSTINVDQYTGFDDGRGYLRIYANSIILDNNSSINANGSGGYHNMSTAGAGSGYNYGPGGAGYTEGATVYNWTAGSGTVTFPATFKVGSGSNLGYAGGGGGGTENPGTNSTASHGGGTSTSNTGNGTCTAGTNGKGSSSHMIASVLQEAGYNVGLYTSPHLKDYRERIRINGSYISEEAVIDFIQNNKTFFEAENLSFFEMSVGMSFWYFAKEKVDIAVVEVGMGGRLDSTNIIMPEVSLITNIGKDHTQFLGTTLPEIAGEKAGIIKENVPVIISEKHPETQEVFIKTAEERNAAIVFAEELKAPGHLSTDLLGSYQEKNIKGVRAVIRQLISQGWKISEEHLREGLKNVRKNTNLRGRWDILQEFPKVICDTAHNREGLMMTMQQLKQTPYRELHIVFGVVGFLGVRCFSHSCWFCWCSVCSLVARLSWCWWFSLFPLFPFPLILFPFLFQHTSKSFSFQLF